MKSANRIMLCLIALMAAGAALSSCDDNKSFAERLDDEKKNINAFLANQEVINHVPEDSVFKCGKDAPYYRMDGEGNVYMQVISKGTDERPEDDDMVYFRYTRYDLGNYASADSLTSGMGNADDMDYEATWFRLNNLTLSASTQYGTGIQVPMNYLGWDAEVNLIIKSQYGFTSETAYVIPFLYNVRYFKPGV